jgi:hypothetical protein
MRLISLAFLRLKRLNVSKEHMGKHTGRLFVSN